MRLSVIFWTRANDYALPHLQRILSCLHQQTFQDFQSIVVCDREFTEKSFAQFYESMKSSLHAIGQDAVLEKVEFKTNINSDFLPNHKWVASYVRNFALQQVDTELVQLFDDDNGFDEEYLRQAILHYDHMRQQTRSEVIITPTLVYRDTKQIQNQGFSKFSYRQSRPILHLLDAKEINTSEIVTPIPQDEIQSFRKDYAEIQMFSGNGLLWNAEVFRSVGYDEEIARIAEDLDFTLSLHERGVKLFVFADLEVRHYEREKTKLEQAWIWNKKQAYQKARNRFLFVYKHGIKKDKLAFRCFGLPGCILWLSIKALLIWKRKGFPIIAGLFQGAWEGYKLVRKSSTS